MVVVLALLAIAPMYERGHVMPDMGVMHGVALDGSGQMADMTALHGLAKPGAHDAACRILCFGWVELATPAPPQGISTKVALVLTPAAVALPHGITTAPRDPPPKRRRV